MKTLTRVTLQAFLLMCTPAAWTQTCQSTAEVCVDDEPCKQFGAFTVCLADLKQTCWHYSNDYQCRSGEMIDYCKPLLERGCEQIGSSCTERVSGPDSECALYDQTYRCTVTPGSVVEKTVCDATKTCVPGSACFDTSYLPDKDFAAAVTWLEVGREAAVYADPASLEMFKGYATSCSKKTLGGSELKDCCEAKSGGQKFTNYNSITGAVVSKAVQAGGEAAVEAAREGISLGSKYVYDALFSKDNPALMKKGVDAMNAVDGAISPATIKEPDFTFYGVEMNVSMANGFEIVGFDPYSFAFQIAMMLIQQWLSCESEEQVTMLKRGQGLCHSLGTYCSEKVLGVCVERREGQCCFNSKLAKLINVQGKQQLGISLGTAKSPLCRGLSQAELTSLDFSRIDLSEFIADVVPTAPNESSIINRAGANVDERVKQYLEKAK